MPVEPLGPDERGPAAPGADATDPLPDLGHPRGTLVIVLIFGLLFGLGWFAMYLYEFLGRGAPRS